MEGRRILAALPRLGCGEGWVWVPSDRVIAQVAFLRIRNFDSSVAPRRAERVRVSGPRPPADLLAIAAALAGAGASAAEAQAGPVVGKPRARMGAGTPAPAA